MSTTECKPSNSTDSHSPACGAAAQCSEPQSDGMDVTTRELFTLYRFAIHLPNAALETARGITATVFPILIRQLVEVKANSDRHATDGHNGDRNTRPASSDTFLGLIFAAMGLGTAVANVPVGYLVRRFDLSTVAASGGVLHLVTTVVLILLIGNIIWKSYLQPYAKGDDNGGDGDGVDVVRVIDDLPYRLFQLILLVSSFLWGASCSFIFITRLLFAQYRVPKVYRSRLLSLIGGAQRWAMVVGPFVAGWVIQYVGIFAAFSLQVPLCALCSYAVYRSGVFRETSDKIKAADAQQKAISAQRREARITTPRRTATTPAAVGGAVEMQRKEGLAVTASSLNSASSVDFLSVTSPTRLLPDSYSHRTIPQPHGIEDTRLSSVLGGDGEECLSLAAAVDVPTGVMAVAVEMCEDIPAAKEVGLTETADPSVTASVAIAQEVSATAAVPSSSSAVAAPASDDHLPGFKEAFRANWRLLLVVGVYTFVVMFMRSSRTLLLTVCALNLGLPASAIGAILSASFAVDATFFFLGGYLSDRYSPERTAVLATSVLGVSFLCLGIPTSPSDIVITDANNIPTAYYFTLPVVKLFLVGILFGFANSVGSGLVMSLMANHAPKSKGNAVLSFLGTVSDVGPLVGSLLTGVLLDGLGFDTTSVLFGLMGVANGLLAWFCLPQRGRNKQPA